MFLIITTLSKYLLFDGIEPLYIVVIRVKFNPKEYKFMSYDIHITRANHWTASTKSPISLDELKALFSAKNDFEYSNTFSISGPIQISINGDFFIWKVDEVTVPFRYFESKLTVSGTDEGDIIDKMKEIANELNAKVQGNEGELY